MPKNLGDLLDGDREGVAILVGPNGSGKSHFLREVAREVRRYRDTAVICNTAYDRFAGVRGIERLSAGRGGQSPKSVVKRAVAQTLEAADSRYFQAGAILDYCGYFPRFGFRIEPSRSPYAPPDFHDEDPQRAIALQYVREAWQSIVWIDQQNQSVEGFRARDFVSVLKNEEWLRRRGYIRDIGVYLDHHTRGVTELNHASSGELSLISSLVFLISLPSRSPVIIIDEPENSLHPTWQREYLDKVLAATTYRNATILIATHAPLIVTGALSHYSGLVSVFQVQSGEPRKLVIGDEATSESIESILYQAFDVITPANHFVSWSMQDVVTRLEKGEIGREEALAIVAEMDRSSFDQKQHDFFVGVRAIIERFTRASEQDAAKE